MTRETAVEHAARRVPSRGGHDAAILVRREREPGLHPNLAHHDLTRRVNPRVPRSTRTGNGPSWTRDRTARGPCQPGATPRVRLPKAHARPEGARQTMARDLMPEGVPRFPAWVDGRRSTWTLTRAHRALPRLGLASPQPHAPDVGSSPAESASRALTRPLGLRRIPVPRISRESSCFPGANEGREVRGRFF